MKNSQYSFFLLIIAFLFVGSAFGAGENKQGNERQLRMMSYNVCNGVGLDKKTDYTRVAKVISKACPDIVALQELDSATVRSGGVVVVDTLARLTGMYATYGKAIDFSGGGYGIGILSREKPLCHYTVPLPGREERRVMLVVEFDRFVIVDCHLSLTEADCNESMRILLDHLERLDKPFFLAGDMNSEPQSEAQRILSSRLSYLSNTTLRTFPSVNPRITIDYICGRQSEPCWYVRKFQVLQGISASDHCPLLVDLVLK